MTNIGEVHFDLYGDNFDPDEVTRAIDIQPTSSQRKADPRPKYTRWSFSTGRIESEFIDVYEMSALVVARLAPAATKIREVKDSLGLKAIFSVALWITTDDSKPTPSIGFDAEVIAFWHAVGATIDVDTYRN